MVAIVSSSVELLDVALIDESPLNPREHWAGIADLASSLQRGQLEPIVVRPYRGRPGRYELADGARRLRAAKEGKLEKLVARVLDLSDAEVLGIILGKGGEGNVDALTAWEEGVAYDRALKLEPKLTLQDLAARHGRSKYFVHCRIALLNLPPAAKTALQDKEITAQQAYLIARLPGEEARIKAEDIVLRGQMGGHVLPYKEAKATIEQLVCKDLKAAPFDVADAKLVESAGACATFDASKKKFCGVCPYHADTDRETYGDVQQAHKCMHPACYDQKVAAWRGRVLTRATEAGKVALTPEENAEVFVAEEKGMSVKSDFVVWGQSPTRDMLKPEVAKAPAWSELCDGDAKVQVYVGIDQAGRVVDLAKLAEAIVAVPKEEAAIFADPVRRRYLIEKPKEPREAAADKSRPASKARDKAAASVEEKESEPEREESFVSRLAAWVASALEAAPTLPSRMRELGFQLLREAGVSTHTQHAEPATESGNASPAAVLAKEWEGLRANGESALSIASIYGVPLEEVCTAINLDVRIARNEFTQMLQEVEEGFAAAGLKSKAARDRVSKLATGGRALSELTLPEQLRLVLRLLSQPKPAAIKRDKAGED